MNTDPTHPSQPKTAEQLDEFLLNRIEFSNENAQSIIKSSNARYGRMNSVDVDSLSKNEKAERLEKLLKWKRQGNRRRQKHVTVSAVKAEAAKILEEFLRSQLEHSTKSPVGRYERYVEASITEEATSPSSEDNSINRQDSIPFADADEEDALLKKADSLPADHKDKYPGDSSEALKVPVIHEKSKSAPDSSPLINNENAQQYVPKRAKAVPPPPPPGTPHSLSEECFDERVPYVGIQQTDTTSNQSSDQNFSHPCSNDAYSLDTLDSYKHSSNKSSDSDPARARRPTPPRQPPDSLDIIPHLIGNKPLFPMSEPNGTKSHSPSPSPQKSSRTLHGKFYTKSGSVSSSDTDNRRSESFHGRKKKSMFKKAQERLRSFLKIQSDKESPTEIPEGNLDQYCQKPLKKHKKKKHHGKGVRDAVEDEMDVYVPPTGKVLEERCTHTNKHIGQHHSQWGGGLVRTEDITEVVDINSPREMKHIEKHWKVKESSESGKGIMGRLKRMTSREKSSKKHMKESKSSTLEQLDKSHQYQRTISAPGHHAGKGHPEPTNETSQKQTVQLHDDGFTVTDIESTVEGRREHIIATQVVSRHEDERRNSSCLDIVDHAGALVEKIWFDPNYEELPRNRSFEFSLESCVHEAKINKNGRIRTVQDVDTHKHLDTAEDLEMDGITEGTENDIEDMTDAERERLYGVIAERLAAIGDSYTTNKQDLHGKSTPANPRAKTTATDSYTSNDEISREHLNPLEKEISDTLREVAENIDEKVLTVKLLEKGKLVQVKKEMT